MCSNRFPSPRSIKARGNGGGGWHESKCSSTVTETGQTRSKSEVRGFFLLLDPSPGATPSARSLRSAGRPGTAAGQASARGPALPRPPSAVLHHRRLLPRPPLGAAPARCGAGSSPLQVSLPRPGKAASQGHGGQLPAGEGTLSPSCSRTLSLPPELAPLRRGSEGGKKPNPVPREIPDRALPMPPPCPFPAGTWRRLGGARCPAAPAVLEAHLAEAAGHGPPEAAGGATQEAAALAGEGGEVIHGGGS